MSKMMLSKLFSWISGKQETLPPEAKVTKSEVNSIVTTAKKEQRKLTADFRQASKAEKSNAERQLTKHNAYFNFIQFCHQQAAPDSLYFLALEYLLSLQDDDVERKEKIRHLFAILLQQNREKTFAFYRKHQQLFEKLPKVKLIVATAISNAEHEVICHLAKFTAQLNEEEHVDTLAHLFISPHFRSLLSDTEKFAAVVLWFFQKVGASQTVKMGLLQNFLAYNSCFLAEEECEVKRLYAILALFPNTEELIKEARKINCKELGDAFSSYNLTGDHDTHASSSDLVRFSRALVPTESNFRKLYELFGLNLLQFIIDDYAESRCDKWHKIFNDFIFSDTEKLVELINFIASVSAVSLKNLAGMVDEKIVTLLINRHDGAVLHFLPHKPALVKRLSSSDLGTYVEDVAVSAVAPFEKINQLTVLFKIIQKDHKTLGNLVYSKIVEIMLENIDLSDDPIFIKMLKKFRRAEVLEKQYKRLQTTFNDFLAKEVEKGPLSPESYQTLEDAWLNLSRQITVLRGLVTFEQVFLRNKYTFQLNIAKAYFQRYAENFSLDGFLSSINFTQTFLNKDISEYERLLLELLAAIDNEALRNLIFAKFNAYSAAKERLKKAFNEEKLVNKAIMYDNAGLLKWVHLKLGLKNIGDLALKAAEIGSWNVSRYLCSLNLPQGIYNHILVLAADNAALDFVMYLCESAIKKLDPKSFEQAFIRAVNKEKIPTINFLWQLNPHGISHSMVAHLLKMAARSQSLLVVNYLGNLVESKLLVIAVEKALIDAVKNNHLLVVQQICQLNINTPCSKTIEKAFLLALENSNLPMARYLSNLKNYSITQPIIDDGLAITVRSKSIHNLHFMFSLKSSYPSQKAINHAFSTLVKKNNREGVALLCRSKVSPVPKLIESGFYEAIKAGCYSLVVYLSVYVKPHVISRGLQCAAQFGDINSVQYIYKFKVPDLRTMQKACKKAELNPDKTVLVYLKQSLPLVRRSFIEWKSSHVIAFPQKSGEKIHRVLSNGQNKHGFFPPPASACRHLSEIDSSENTFASDLGELEKTLEGAALN